MKEINIKNVAITFVVALIIWFIPAPKVYPECMAFVCHLCSNYFRNYSKSRTYGNNVYDGHRIYSPYTGCSSGDAGKSITKALSGFGDKVIWL
jgi:DASS family divalent anion:Na+ symporter